MKKDLIDIRTYKPPFGLKNSHLATIWPALTRKIVPIKPYERERIQTEDDDFLDLDWLKKSNESLVVICHGLEGNSERPYIVGMANAFFNRQVDVLAWNYRGCSGQVNRQKRVYHSGATDDLDIVIEHALRDYKTIYLVGFSLGGNLSLKYLGEKGAATPVSRCITFSVPLDLQASAFKIRQRSNFLYERRFLRSLGKKVKAKSNQFPEVFSASKLEKVKTIIDFDDIFTGPIHGFENSKDYYAKCSSKAFLNSISIPTLVVNALNDPFLPVECFDHSLFEKNQIIRLETPENGGHCGFAKYDNELFWSEERALCFVLEGA